MMYLLKLLFGVSLMPYLLFFGALICTLMSADRNTGTIGMAAGGLWVAFAILQVHRLKHTQEQRETTRSR